MNGTILLIILAVVVLGALLALVPLARHALRLYRGGRRAQAELVPLAEGLARRADLAAGKAAALGEKGEDLSERLAELQRTVARVSVLARAMGGASDRWSPLRRHAR